MATTMKGSGTQLPFARPSVAIAKWCPWFGSLVCPALVLAFAPPPSRPSRPRPPARSCVRAPVLCVCAFVCPSVSSVRPYARSSVRVARSCVRPSCVRPSCVRSPVRSCVRPSVRPSVRPLVRPSVRASPRPRAGSWRPSCRPAVKVLAVGRTGAMIVFSE